MGVKELLDRLVYVGLQEQEWIHLQRFDPSGICFVRYILFEYQCPFRSVRDPQPAFLVVLGPYVPTTCKMKVFQAYKSYGGKELEGG